MTKWDIVESQVKELKSCHQKRLITLPDLEKSLLKLVFYEHGVWCMVGFDSGLRYFYDEFDCQWKLLVGTKQ